MQPLSDRTAGFTDSVIRRMTRISNQYGAVNLSQGFPDFDPPKAILDRLAEVAHEDYHQYSITWGAQNFREALAAKQTRYDDRHDDRDEPGGQGRYLLAVLRELRRGHDLDRGRANLCAADAAGIYL